VISQHLPAGNVRLLAILAEHRLPGSFANVPTAKELGYNATWTLWRGLYMGPDVSEAEYNWWVDTLGKLIYTPEFVKKRESQRLYPFTLIGKDFDAYVKKNAQAFRDFFKTLY
jgi:putative tricarboxylic transport membrane protein